ncbi:lipopolysaccharide transport periplasmic protein LptA [Photobacterium leiognathi]|uniref:lipopolysaccharide transport periplasmic protein LptA n=1 Tax=Photobacterium leiognathi TaxID=553611 RepID=UPI002981D9CC|nr:lipopolysaccharide transport periplasmic protein LptA [Photobacterium leiognathi]
MKLKLFTAGLMLLLSSSVLAEQTQNQLPIHLSAITQDVDVINNVTTLTGKVDITQGGVQIKADKAVIKLDSKTKDLKSVEVYGKPAYFHRVMEDGKVVDGESLYGMYTPSNNMMVLKDKAKITQDDSTIKAAQISYNLATQVMKAKGSKKNQVNTVLLPEKLK